MLPPLALDGGEVELGRPKAIGPRGSQQRLSARSLLALWKNATQVPAMIMRLTKGTERMSASWSLVSSRFAAAIAPIVMRELSSESERNKPLAQTGNVSHASNDKAYRSFRRSSGGERAGRSRRSRRSGILSGPATRSP